ncbi:MAG TPA: metallophosphoesterase [Ktedonobacteraceae bacterium]|nr:metallophosphoesterase [Ktedonobacteraceae bacterium]
MNIAIFADLHGYLHLCFKICARWEKETGEQIDIILQTGDMGIYPDESWLDPATHRHALRDPEELGFMDSFARYDADVAATLQRMSSNIIFIRGNHEAHGWLDQREAHAPDPLFAVDIYQRVYCLKSGIPYTFSRNGEQVTILGLGRIAGRNGQIGWKPSYVQDYELVRLQQIKDQQIDIFLTHDAPSDLLYWESGLPLIDDILEQHRPLYHFFGHYMGYQCLEFCYLNHVTSACKLAEPHFNRRDPRRALLPGCMGMLRWSHHERHRFEIVDAPWLSEYRPETWRAL